MKASNTLNLTEATKIANLINARTWPHASVEVCGGELVVFNDVTGLVAKECGHNAREAVECALALKERYQGLE
jgi:hypothetical protein